MTATSIPGSRTSIPYSARPVTMSRASTTRRGRPAIFHSRGSLSFASPVGGGSVAAMPASWPYETRRPSRCRTWPSAVRKSGACAFQSCAAAATSRARACAPALRWSSQASGMLVLPPTPWSPTLSLSPSGVTSSKSGIGSTVTSSQRTSSSSAISIGNAVRTPCPISVARAPIVTRLSGSMRMKSPSAAAPGLGLAAKTSGQRNRTPPAAVADTTRKSRRVSLFIDAPASTSPRP